MEDKNVQESQIHPDIAHQKVIQPPASFEEKRSSSQPSSKQASAPQNVTQPSPPPAQPMRPAPPSSVYPEAINGIATSEQTAPTASVTGKTQEKEVLNPTKIRAVRIAACVLLLLQLSYIYTVVTLWTTYHNTVNMWGFIIALIMTALLTGIIQLKESARVAYVFISAVMLAFTIFASVSLYLQLHNNPSVSANVHPLTKTQIENSMHAAEKNSSLSPQIKQQIIKDDQKQIAALSKSPVEQKLRKYISMGISWGAAILPLVFFTRPSIKKVFS